MERSSFQVLTMLESRASTSYPPDYRSHDSRRPAVYAVSITIFALAVFFVSLRFYARSRLSRFRGPDDYWILAATCFSAGEFAIKMTWLHYGLGRHVWNLSRQQLSTDIKLTYAIQALYPMSLGLTKISILTFYLRLFPYEIFRRICYVGRYLVGCLTTSIFLAMLFGCTPIHYGWSLGSQGHCVNEAGLQYASSSLNLFTDVCILLLPIKYLWAMSTDKKKRLGCIVVFSTGLLTCIAGAIRITTIAKFYANGDRTWTGAYIAICSALEGNLAIITTSIPACRPIVRALSKKVLPQRWFSDSRSCQDESYHAPISKQRQASGARTTDTTLQFWNDSEV